MATDKRERQRANREQRRAEEAKVKRRQQAIVRARRIAIWLVAIVIALALAAVVF